MTDQERRAREAVRRVLVGLKRSLSKDGNRQFFREKMRNQTTEWLIEAAREGHSDATELLRERARAARQTGERVPDELHAFVWEMFLDGPPSKRPGPKPEELLLRNMLITGLVAVVVDEFGFAPTRARTAKSKDAPPSGCSIVAEELCSRKLPPLNVPLDEGGVEDVWNNGKGYRAGAAGSG